MYGVGAIIKGTGTPIDTATPPFAMAGAAHNNKATPANIPEVAAAKYFFMIIIPSQGRTRLPSSSSTHGSARQSAQFSKD